MNSSFHSIIPNCLYCLICVSMSNLCIVLATKEVRTTQPIEK